MRKGVPAVLVAGSNITAIVSTRVYDEPPQNVTYPFVRYGDLNRAEWTLIDQLTLR